MRLEKNSFCVPATKGVSLFGNVSQWVGKNCGHKYLICWKEKWNELLQNIYCKKLFEILFRFSLIKRRVSICLFVGHTYRLGQQRVALTNTVRLLNWVINAAIAQWICHSAAPGSSPKHTIYAFIIFVLNLSCEKNENKQKEAGFGPSKINTWIKLYVFTNESVLTLRYCTFTWSLVRGVICGRLGHLFS